LLFLHVQEFNKPLGGYINLMGWDEEKLMVTAHDKRLSTIPWICPSKQHWSLAGAFIIVTGIGLLVYFNKNDRRGPKASLDKLEITRVDKGQFR
jgi:hypothetical protein